MPKSLKRIVSDASLKEAKQHTAIQGEIIYVANRLHDAFYRTFRISLALNRANAAENIELKYDEYALAQWHVLQSDSSQRDLAIASISAIPTEVNLTPALHRLKWAIISLTTLADLASISGVPYCWLYAMPAASPR